MTPEKVKCWNCLMTFKVEDRSNESLVQRCPEKGCGKRFWSAKNGDGRQDIKLGVLPIDKDTFTPVHVPNR